MFKQSHVFVLYFYFVNVAVGGLAGICTYIERCIREINKKKKKKCATGTKLLVISAVMIVHHKQKRNHLIRIHYIVISVFFFFQILSIDIYGIFSFFALFCHQNMIFESSHQLTWKKI